MSFQKLLLPALFLLALPSLSTAQFLQVTGANTPPFTPQNLISNVFLGNGVEVTDIQYNGVATAVGYFTGGTQSIGIDRGIVMTTGLANSQGGGFGSAENGNVFASVDNPSTAFDADLAGLTTAGLNDVSVYTIKFIPTADTLRFRYCFGSEEYPEYACSPFNDVFGFFIQGPGYPTPTNIARIPGTALPVTINNIHPANPAYNCGPLNAQYYNNNNNSTLQPTYDGFTDVFIAEAIVTPCLEYTIKLAIADVSDGIFDSGVFLEAKSFGTGSLRVEVATVSLDGSVAEGCSPGTLTFRLPSPAEQDFPLDYNIWGSATNGIDYQTIAAGMSIPAGATDLVIPIVAFEDNLAEAPEFIAIDFERDICNRDTVYIFIRDNILIPPNLRADTTLCVGSPPLDLDGTLPIPLPDPPSFTNTQNYSIAPTNAAVVSPINVFGVQPNTMGPGVIRSVCVNITHPWIDDIDMYLLAPGGQFLELSTDNGSNGDNYTNACFTPNAAQAISFPGPFAPSTAAPFTGDWLPEGPWDDLWDGTNPSNGTWRLQVVDDANGFVGTLDDWTITFEPSYKIDYQWLPIAGISCPTCPMTLANPTQNTTYTVRATDTYGCMVEDSVHIDVVPALAAPVVQCAGSDASSITFSWNSLPNSSGFEVNINGAGWSAPTVDTFYNVTGLVPNSSVTIEVRGINALFSCPANIGTVTCENCQSPAVSALVQDVSCFGASDGSVTVTTDNLNPPYTFTLNGTTSASGIFTGIGAGAYQVAVSDVQGCSALVPVTVGSPDAIAPVVSTTQDVSCFGGNDGMLSVAVSGGTGPVSFVWGAPGNPAGPTVLNLTSGTYSVTATDANGCTAVASGSINEPTDLGLTLTHQNVVCFGDANGFATAAGNGGTGPYSYLWSNMDTGPTANNLGPGTYSVTVTDAQGCAETSVTTILEPPALTATAVSTPVDCQGGNNGTATVTPQGGVGNYSFKWNDANQQTSATASGLSPQIYSVTVTDGNGCITVQAVVVNQPPALSVNLTSTDVSCNGGSDGTLLATPNGGNGGYQYQWSAPGAPGGPMAGGLAAGAYTVTVTDQKGCTAVGQAGIAEPTLLSASATANNVSCFNSTNGQVTLNVQGGTSPYSYLWSGGQTSPNINNLLPGAYQVTVTDNKQCTAVAQANVGAPSAITGTIVVADVPCFGQPDGSLTLNASGGTGTLSVAWSGPNNFTGTGNVLSNLSAGAYTATVTDAAGCLLVLNTSIAQPALLVLDLPEVSDTVCFNATDGFATALPVGGTPPYGYQWNAGAQTTSGITDLAPGRYFATVTDAHGCIAYDSTLIVQRSEVFAFVEGVDPNCHDGSDGLASVTAIFYGSTAANLNTFQYNWSTTPAQSNGTATALRASQTYSVTVTDAQGCSDIQTVTMGNPDPVIARIEATANAGCQGAATGWAAAGAAGGTAPYSYFWSTPSGPVYDSLATGLRAGSYRVTATDAKGCYGTAFAEITEPTTLLLALTSRQVDCFGGDNGSALMQAGGGTPPYEYAWSTGDADPELTGLTAGMFSATLTDANGCTTTNFVEVRQPDAPLAGEAQSTPVTCFGGSDGSILLTGLGGSPPYRYALDGGAGNGSPIQIGLRAGSYTPQIIDAHGCTIVLPDIEVEEPDPVQVDLGPDITVVLGEGVGLEAQVYNAEYPVSYSWDDQTSLLSCIDCPTPYIDSIYWPQVFTLTVRDARGCIGEDQIKVLVDKPRRIFVPTGFTPNGDGQNDYLLVHGQASATILDFKVYDRWGELVYQNGGFHPNDPQAGWDGTFRGKEMDPGVYVWVLEATYLDGVREVFKGDTALIR